MKHTLWAEAGQFPKIKKSKMKKDTDSRHKGITIIATGTPRPQPRPRFANGRVISTADKNARLWISRVQFACKQATEIVGGKDAVKDLVGLNPLSVRMQFRFQHGADNGRRPKSGREVGMPHAQKPDVDNLAKLVLDVLTRSGVIGDDCIVASLTVEKVWGLPSTCGVTVKIAEFTPQEDLSGLTDKQGYPPEPCPAIPSWVKTVLSQSEDTKKG
jgi:Holliday junction resolvase RusA-like endonuclease